MEYRTTKNIASPTIFVCMVMFVIRLKSLFQKPLSFKSIIPSFHLYIIPIAERSEAKLTLMLGVLFFVTTTGCYDHGTENINQYLIRLGDRVLTVSDFNRAFEIAKAAYPQNAMQPADVLRNARVRLLNQLFEELIVLERAKELGLSVTESEVENAISELKQDYPEDVFEQTLLEQAVPYASWKEGIKSRLLLEKVIAQELDGKIAITPEDISKYYEQHFQETGPDSDMENRPSDIDEIIVKNLRREKLEEAYALWIKGLQKRYTVEINREQWEKILGS